MRTQIMRDASYLLPPPGGEVVRDLLDIYDELENRYNELWKNVIQLESEYEAMREHAIAAYVRCDKKQEVIDKANARYSTLLEAVKEFIAADADWCAAHKSGEPVSGEYAKAARAEVDRLLESAP